VRWCRSVAHILPWRVGIAADAVDRGGSGGKKRKGGDDARPLKKPAKGDDRCGRMLGWASASCVVRGCLPAAAQLAVMSVVGACFCDEGCVDDCAVGADKGETSKPAAKAKPGKGKADADEGGKGKKEKKKKVRACGTKRCCPLCFCAAAEGLHSQDRGRRWRRGPCLPWKSGCPARGEHSHVEMHGWADMFCFLRCAGPQRAQEGPQRLHVLLERQP
jgi:hypothetical protein